MNVLSFLVFHPLSLSLSSSVHSLPPRRSARLHGCQPQRAETRRRCRVTDSSLPSAPRHRIAAAAADRRVLVAPALVPFLSLTLSLSLVRDATLRACVEWRQRRQARPPEPQRSVAGDDSAAGRRLPSVSGKMGAPRRAVA